MQPDAELTRDEKTREVSDAILTLLRELMKLNSIRSLRYSDVGEASACIAASLNAFALAPFDVQPADVEKALTRLHHGKKLITSKRLLDPDAKEMKHCIFLRK